MRDLVEYIARQIVSDPDGVKVEEKQQDGLNILELTVSPVDMGIVIGKKGQTIKAIRKLLAVRAMAENVRVNLQLIDPEGAHGTPLTADRQTDEAESVKP